jgi:lysophospholipase L1-like esterase
MLSSYMFIFKKNYFKLHQKKNKTKNYFRYFLYFFVFLFCITVTSLCSCSSLTRKTEKIASGIPFNYPGLRIETRGISFEDISNNYPRIVCFGDSVTFGWNIRYDLSYPYLLGKNLEGKYPGVKVINCGVGGNTVTDALARIEKDVLSYKPHLVIINFGLNDGMLKKQVGNSQPTAESLYYKKDSSYFFPQVNISDFDERYRHIINLLKDYNISVLVLGMSPVADNFPAGQEEDFRKKQKDIYLVYNERIRKIAAENMLDFLNIWEVFSSQKVQDEYLQSDGVHPNEAGQGLISESLFKYITENNMLRISGNVQN